MKRRTYRRHPPELRAKILAERAAGEKVTDLAEKYDVSRSLIDKWATRAGSGKAKRAVKRTKRAPTRKVNDDVDRMTEELLAFWREPLRGMLGEFVELAVERKLAAVKKALGEV